MSETSPKEHWETPQRSFALLFAGSPLPQAVTSVSGATRPLDLVVNAEHLGVLNIKTLLDSGFKTVVVYDCPVPPGTPKRNHAHRVRTLFPGRDVRFVLEDDEENRTPWAESLYRRVTSLVEEIGEDEPVAIFAGDTRIVSVPSDLSARTLFTGNATPGMKGYHFLRSADPTDLRSFALSLVCSARDLDHLREMSDTAFSTGVDGFLSAAFCAGWTPRALDFHDFGNRDGFVQSMVGVHAPRATNSVRVTAPGVVVKVCSDTSQSKWFAAAEKSLSGSHALPVFPRVLWTSDSDGSYGMEAVPAVNLAYQIQTGALNHRESIYAVSRVLDALSLLHRCQRGYTLSGGQSEEVYLKRPLGRLRSSATFFTPAYLPLAESALRTLAESRRNAALSLVHGDPVLSNVLYDSGTGRVMLLDPRGVFANDLPTGVGDPFYDYIKLLQSLSGYDRVKTVPDGFSPIVDTSEHVRLVVARAIGELGCSERDLMLGAGALMGSCVALHGDTPNHQTQLAALSSGIILRHQHQERTP